MQSPVSNGFAKWEQKWKCLREILLKEGNHSPNSMVICWARCIKSLRGGTGSEVLILISPLKSINILHAAASFLYLLQHFSVPNLILRSPDSILWSLSLHSSMIKFYTVCMFHRHCRSEELWQQSQNMWHVWNTDSRSQTYYHLVQWGFSLWLLSFSSLMNHVSVKCIEKNKKENLMDRWGNHHLLVWA